MATVEEHYRYAALAPDGHAYGMTASHLFSVDDQRAWVTNIKDAKERANYARSKASQIGILITVEVVRRKITVITGDIEGVDDEA